MRELMQNLFHFRNTSHECFFYMTIGVLIACVCLYLIFKWQGQFYFFAFKHIVVSISATYKVLWLKEKSDLYSIDCIWFNGLVMLGIYIAILTLIHYHEKKLREKATDSSSFKQYQLIQK